MAYSRLVLATLGIISGACAVSDEQFEEERRKTERFVTEAIDHFLKTPLFEACHDFVTRPQWNGSVRMLFVLDQKNRCLVFDRELPRIWRPFPTVGSLTGTPFLDGLHIRAQDEHGGWLSGEWLGSLVHVYVRDVIKDDAHYLVGAFCFSWSPSAQINALATKIQSAFTTYDTATLAQRVSNPRGDFVRGTYGIYMYTKDGICLANPYISELVPNSIEPWVDDSGASILSLYRQTLTKNGLSGWCSYSLEGEIRKELVTRLDSYFFVIGYYPLCNEAFVKKFLTSAITQGTKEGVQSLHDFMHPYRKAGLSVLVYDSQGVVLADSGYPALVGANNLQVRDEQLHFRTKEIIELCDKYTTGFIVTTLHGSPMLLYGTRVLSDDKAYYYVVRGYTSEDRRYKALSLSEEIADYIKNLRGTSLFGDIARLPDSFLRAGLVVEIYDMHDYCVFSTLAPWRLWKRLKRPFPANGWITRTLKNGTYQSYITSVEREDATRFVVCVGYHE